MTLAPSNERIDRSVVDDADGSAYAELQHFYARQMQLLDGGDTAAWARTFTVDGVFAAGGVPEPVAGRDAIAAAAGGVAATFAAAGIQRRHWIGMLTVDRHSPDAATARCYALVLEVPVGGEVVARRSTVCDDRLVREGDTWLVAHRVVTRDGLD